MFVNMLFFECYLCYNLFAMANTNKKSTKKKVKKINSKYFDFYDDIKIDGRDTEW